MSQGQRITLQQPSGHRQTVRLGRPLGRGGAGTVYAVEGTPDRAVKIYHVGSRQAYEQKIGHMVRRQPHFRNVTTTWPQAVAYDEHGDFLGFEMCRIEDSSAHVRFVEYLHPPLRRRKGVSGSVQTRLAVCANFAAVINTLHNADCCIIDFNPMNFVLDRGRVVLLDCDGYSVQAGASVLKSQQWTPGYACPEAQTSTSHGTHPAERGVHQDRFALAVFVFRLLNRNLHPAAGLGSADTPSTEQGKIDAWLFPHQPSPPHGYAPPKQSLFAHMPSGLQDLFYRAFDRHNINNRPSAQEWHSTLLSLHEMVEDCPNSEDHFQIHSHCAACNTRVRSTCQGCGDETSLLNTCDEHSDLGLLCGSCLDEHIKGEHCVSCGSEVDDYNRCVDYDCDSDEHYCNACFEEHLLDLHTGNCSQCDAQIRDGNSLFSEYARHSIKMHWFCSPSCVAEFDRQYICRQCGDPLGSLLGGMRASLFGSSDDTYWVNHRWTAHSGHEDRFCSESCLDEFNREQSCSQCKTFLDSHYSESRELNNRIGHDLRFCDGDCLNRFAAEKICAHCRYPVVGEFTYCRTCDHPPVYCDNDCFRQGHSCSGQNKSTCFITTAVCTHRGLPDDCTMLETLRAFRDTWMQAHAPRDVAIYRQVAPLIVKAVSEQPNPGTVWEWVWQSCLLPAQRAIEQSEMQRAHTLYLTMVHALAERFDVSMPKG